MVRNLVFRKSFTGIIYYRLRMSSDVEILLIAVLAVSMLIVGLVLLFLVMMIRNYRKIEKAQKEKLSQLRLFSDRLQNVREEEQKRIARELHDELGGNLTSLKYDLLWLEQRVSSQKEAADRCRALRDLIDSTTKTVQRISSELRPKILDSLGLVEALRWQVGEFTKRTGIPVAFHPGEDIPSLPEVTTVGLYRIVQESLTNIARHAHATQVIIEIQNRSGSLHIQVRDNGKGFSMELLHHPDSLGLLSLQERARMIGGTVDVQSSPGSGTLIDLALPVTELNSIPEE
jgi:signal transduction histidine kinase